MLSEQNPLSTPVLGQGYVQLIGHYRTEADIARSARVSYQSGTKSVSNDASLIDYLIRHNHGSPLEMPVVSFEVSVPQFVLVHFLRHRIGVSVNSASYRYSEVDDSYYQPESWRPQGRTNKQVGEGELTDQDSPTAMAQQAYFLADGAYHDLLELGVSREQARSVIPAGVFQKAVFQFNLRSFFHLSGLRLAEGAQQETREVVQAMYDLVKPLYPCAFKSWENHVRDAVQFSRDELDILSDMLSQIPGGPLINPLPSVSRNAEFLRKLERVSPRIFDDD